ncbi:heme o synthase [soil metagenome]
MKIGAIEKTASVEAPPLVQSGTSNRALVDFAELIKARLTLLVLVTTAVGFYLGAVTVGSLALFHVVFGTALAAAGAAALNQWWEHRLDALMHRTRTRPIPAGRMTPRDALLLGSALGVAGVCYLAIACNALSAALAAATIGIYLFGYTPLKRISVSNTLVGAIPGALPPMIGWAAARNDLSWASWSLFAILFCWQMPHFFAIAWLFRDDYARAGFRMLSSRDLNGIRSGRQSVFFAFLLLMASALPPLLGLTSRTSLPVVLLLGLLFFGLAVRFYLKRETAEARWLFLGSIIYLPLVLVVLVLTKI